MKISVQKSDLRAERQIARAKILFRYLKWCSKDSVLNDATLHVCCATQAAFLQCDVTHRHRQMVYQEPQSRDIATRP